MILLNMAGYSYVLTCLWPVGGLCLMARTVSSIQSLHLLNVRGVLPAGSCRLGWRQGAHRHTSRLSRRCRVDLIAGRVGLVEARTLPLRCHVGRYYGIKRVGCRRAWNGGTV